MDIYLSIGVYGIDAVSWKNLAYQPYFSLTAANVAYPYWSHDLVGPHDDHELHTRWLQWGAFSGVFRTHEYDMIIPYDNCLSYHYK